MEDSRYGKELGKNPINVDPFKSERFLETQAYEFLMRMPFDVKKVREREQLFRNNPKLRIRINIQRIKSIIDYIDFKCHPNSSVAWNQAIKRSDIDLGLVVLREKTTTEQELEFIKELRDQGFSVYHQKEIDEIEKRLKDPIPDREKRKLAKEMSKREFRKICFHTKTELEEMKAKRSFNNVITNIYIAGRKIQ